MAKNADGGRVAGAAEEEMTSLKQTNLYVKNLDESVTDDELRDHFSPYGIIRSYKVMRDRSGVSKGYGFVAFTDVEEASKAIENMNGKMVATKPIYVSLAERKEDCEARLQQAQFSQIRPVVGPRIPIYPLHGPPRRMPMILSRSPPTMSLIPSGSPHAVGSRMLMYRPASQPVVGSRMTMTLPTSPPVLGSRMTMILPGSPHAVGSRMTMILLRSPPVVGFRMLMYLPGSPPVVGSRMTMILPSTPHAVGSRMTMILPGSPRVVGSRILYRPGSPPEVGSRMLMYRPGSPPVVGSRMTMILPGSPHTVGSRMLLYRPGSPLEVGSRMLMSRPGSPPVVGSRMTMILLGTPHAVGSRMTMILPGSPHAICSRMSMYRPGSPPELGSRISMYRPGSPPAIGPRMPPPPHAMIPQVVQYMTPVRSPMPTLPMMQQRSVVSRRGGAHSQPQKSSHVRSPPMMQQRSSVSPRGVVVDSTTSKSLPIEDLATTLKKADPEHQINILGNMLYPLVKQHEPEFAPKITGMLLEQDQTYIVELLKSPDALKAIIAKAMDILSSAADK